MHAPFSWKGTKKTTGVPYIDETSNTFEWLDIAQFKLVKSNGAKAKPQINIAANNQINTGQFII
jgi:hypothetical protein